MASQNPWGQLMLAGSAWMRLRRLPLSTPTGLYLTEATGIEHSLQLSLLPPRLRASGPWDAKQKATVGDSGPNAGRQAGI